MAWSLKPKPVILVAPTGLGDSGNRGDTVEDADQLDKDQIEQLHAATLQVSSNCFELKKLCVTVLVASATLVATFSKKRLDTSVFAAGIIVVVLFWLADSQSYFIQAKLRQRMKNLQQARVLRKPSLAAYPTSGVGLPVDSRSGKMGAVLKSLFNQSMLYYLALLAIVVTAWILFAAGKIS